MIVAGMTNPVADMIMFRKKRSEEAFWNSQQQQQQTLLKWCNFHLKRRGFYVQNISDLQDGICIIVLLEILTGKNVFDDDNEIQTGGAKNEQQIMGRVRNFKIIQKHLPDVKCMDIIHKLEDSRLLTKERTRLLCYLLWQIVLRHQINETCGASEIHEKLSEVEHGSSRLLKWVNLKLSNHTLTNWTTDWVDGVCLCELVNAIRPDTIPEAMFQNHHQHHQRAEMTADLACQVAEDSFGIPEILSPKDIANGNVDEKCMMTYISLFRHAADVLSQGIVPKEKSNAISNNSTTDIQNSIDSVPYQLPNYVAFGSGLCWAQVGKSAEFFVKSSSFSSRGQERVADATSLSISIECHPFDVRPVFHKPALQIKPIDETTYLVRYTPTRPGKYLINILCNGQNIPNSPYRLDIIESSLQPKNFECKEIVVNLHSDAFVSPNHPSSELRSFSRLKALPSTASDDSRHDSAFVDDDSIRTPSDIHSDGDTTPPPWLHAEFHELFKSLTESSLESPSELPMKIFGKGLHFGVVGRICTFHVLTPNTTTGPLGVSIVCPALSLPVPCVKTKFLLSHFAHEVLYIPTEPGIYEVVVKWGELELPGSPFHLAVSESDKNCDSDRDSLVPCPPSLEEYRDRSKHNIYLYYSATSTDDTEHEQKTALNNLLHKKNPFDKIIPIALDIELTHDRREKLYNETNTRKLPFAFVNDTFLGTYGDLMSAYSNDDSLTGFIKRSSQSFKTRLQRLSSSGSAGTDGRISPFSTEV